jgi:tRNA(Glu) U13 pseudouridine synthase TruD
MEHCSCGKEGGWLTPSRLSTALKVPMSAIAIAGVKDKRAVTYQYVTVQDVSPARLLDVNRSTGACKDVRSHIRHQPLSIGGRPQGNKGAVRMAPLAALQVGNLASCRAPICRGALYGNHFRIVVRGLRLLPVAGQEGVS